MDAALPFADSPVRRSAADAAAHAHVLAAQGAEILAAIRRPEINLAIWMRKLDPEIARFARAGAALPDLHVVFEARATEVAPALAAAVGDAVPGRDCRAWIEDVRRLARLFAWATGARDLSIHVEALTHDACRLFHVDNVRGRLIVTYAGPGTQWLADTDTRREALGSGDNNAVRRPGTPIRRLHTGWVGLFKGERLPAMQGRGIVHRSAPIRATGRRRLVLKIGYAGEIAHD